jgi:hypothetical protein
MEAVKKHGYEVIERQARHAKARLVSQAGVTRQSY